LQYFFHFKSQTYRVVVFEEWLVSRSNPHWGLFYALVFYPLNRDASNDCLSTYWPQNSNCWIMIINLDRYFHIREVVVSAGVCPWSMLLFGSDSITTDIGSFWLPKNINPVLLIRIFARHAAHWFVFRLTNVHVKRISPCYLGLYVLFIPDCHYMVRFVPETLLQRLEQHNDTELNNL
jgi:hypothetical protein